MDKTTYLAQLKSYLRLPREQEKSFLAEVDSHLYQYDFNNKDMEEFGDPQAIAESVNADEKISWLKLLTLRSTWELFLISSIIEIVAIVPAIFLLRRYFDQLVVQLYNSYYEYGTYGQYRALLVVIGIFGLVIFSFLMRYASRRYRYLKQARIAVLMCTLLLIAIHIYTLLNMNASLDILYNIAIYGSLVLLPQLIIGAIYSKNVVIGIKDPATIPVLLTIGIWTLLIIISVVLSGRGFLLQCSEYSVDCSNFRPAYNNYFNSDTTVYIYLFSSALFALIISRVVPKIRKFTIKPAKQIRLQFLIVALAMIMTGVYNYLSDPVYGGIISKLGGIPYAFLLPICYVFAACTVFTMLNFVAYLKNKKVDVFQFLLGETVKAD